MVNTRYVIAGLLAVPLLDALLLVFVAGAIGGVATVALVVLTGLVGMLLVRAEGRHTLGKLRERAVRGESPTDQLLDGAFLIAAGAFLLTPGLVTDTLGLLFVIPLTRYPLREALRQYVVVPYLDRKTDGFATGNVYVGGFPGDGPESGAGGSGGSDARPGGDDVYDVDDDEYSVN